MLSWGRQDFLWSDISVSPKRILNLKISGSCKRTADYSGSLETLV